MFQDVPISVDFRLPEHAAQWTGSAMTVRPWRAEFFDTFAREINIAGTANPCRVLELGSGPGFLAERVLGVNSMLTYVAVDFSAAMHELAKQRLSTYGDRIQYVERNLRDQMWGEGLGEFNFVLTHQVVHELRHKAHAPALHAQVRERLGKDGAYLVCDHFFGKGGMSNDQLYMTVDEQKQALLAAGFSNVVQLLIKGGLVLFRAT